MDRHLIPYFNDTDIRTITKLALKGFRTELKHKDGRKGKKMSNKRINNIMAVLRLILNAATEEFKFPSPFEKLGPLVTISEDINPFSLDEVKVFLGGVRADFVNYYKVRFFSGMRTAEIDGLKWEYVDFKNKKILVRETWLRKKWDTPKTQSSIRDIEMSKTVEEALREQKKVTGHLDIVFANKRGTQLDYNLITKRIWYPTLKRLGLKKRTAYQTRHTAATLWLASGENPEWVARQLGHSSTQMLFKVYSKFIPNLTRKDGSAFEKFLDEKSTELGGKMNIDEDASGNPDDISEEGDNE
jgi:integrase